MIEMLVIPLAVGLEKIHSYREKLWANSWQVQIDKAYHGTPLKPYDWQLEDCHNSYRSKEPGL